MSQVKNLRAMFENKGDDGSSPDRGRSPGRSGTSTPAGASFSGSPRPLSKVRTSFVAIEKDGRIGLSRNASDDGSIPRRRRMSGTSDADSASVLSEGRSAAGDEAGKTVRKTLLRDPIPESPRVPQENPAFPPAADPPAAVTDEPSVNPDKKMDEEQPKATLEPADPAVAAGAPAKPATKTAVGTKAADTVTRKTARPNPTSARGSAQPPAVKSSAAGSRAPTSGAATGAKGTAKTTTTTRTAAPKTAATGSTRTATSSAAAAKTTASAPAKKNMQLKPSTSGTGFVKPKVKSPTKPVNLPSSLTAPTASSGARGTRQSPAAQTGNAQSTRAPSRNSAAAGSKPAPKSVATKPVRSSVGPPPSKKTAQEKPASTTKSVDEGFLARMMRPTAASAQKTANKEAAEVSSPPRRAAGRPSTSGTASSRRESSVRSASRPRAPSARSSDAQENTQTHEPSIDEVAVDTAIAETVEEVADAVEGTQISAPEQPELSTVDPAAETAAEPETATKASPSMEEAEPEHVSSPAPAPAAESVAAPEVHITDDIVIETANVETAEEAAEVAVEADLVQTPVEPEDDPPAVSGAVDEAAGEAVTEAMEEPAPALNDDMVEETAVVETAEEVAAIAEETDFVQTPVAPEPTVDIADELAALKIHDKETEAAPAKPIEEASEDEEEEIPTKATWRPSLGFTGSDGEGDVEGAVKASAEDLAKPREQAMARNEAAEGRNVSESVDELAEDKFVADPTVGVGEARTTGKDDEVTAETR